MNSYVATVITGTRYINNAAPPPPPLLPVLLPAALTRRDSHGYRSAEVLSPPEQHAAGPTTAEHSVTLPASPKIGKVTPINTSMVYYRVEQTDGPCWFRHTAHVGSPALDERTSPTAPRKLRSDCPLQIQQGVFCARSPSYSDSSGCAGAFWAEPSCPFSSSSASGFPSYLPKSVCSCVLSGFGLNKK